MTTGRFAPSPSAPLHLGNLRTALLAWCASRSVGGAHLLRIEDLTTSSAVDHAASQIADLATIGLDHDGAVLRQSQRRDRYRRAVAELERADRTYPCWCSRREIREAVAAPHGPAPDGPYPGTCRDLGPDERRALERGGRRPALRLRADGVTVGVRDRLLGRSSTTVDDFVLRRADGEVAYNLAVVVDDAESGVDLVVRGDDLWETTPRQVLLQHLLGFDTPAYLHVPMALGPGGHRLAKRDGAVTLADRLASGATVPEVVGLMAASAGLADPGEEIEARTVLERFDVARLRREPWILSG